MTPPGTQSHKPLTPAELDKLRLRELNQLNEYTRRQANGKLSTAQRNAAARGIGDLQRAADRRLRAELKREQVLRDQLSRERAKAKAPPPTFREPRPTSPAQRARPPQRQSTTPSRTPQRRRQAEQQTCLLDQDTGQYICPQ
jgi:hypothetical protein